MDSWPAAGLIWHRGRQCEIGNCVEVAAHGDRVVLRSSTDPAGTLTVSRTEFADFLIAAKAGDFDGVIPAPSSGA